MSSMRTYGDQKRFDELEKAYRDETDLKRLDAILVCLRRECGELDHCYNDQGVCEWCGEIHWSIPKQKRGHLTSMVDAVLSRIRRGEQPKDLIQ